MGSRREEAINLWDSGGPIRRPVARIFPIDDGCEIPIWIDKDIERIEIWMSEAWYPGVWRREV